MRLVQIVPRLPPPAEGVGSYALALAEALRSRFGIATSFLASDPPEGDGWEVDGFGAEAIPRRGRARAIPELLEAAEAEAVLLHYANYGYQRRGCPLPLPRAVRRFKAGASGRRLVTVFHEVFATGPPWRSSFWTAPLQRAIAGAVARASDAAVTSLDLYVRRLGRAAAPARTVVTPVFSNLGEPEGLPPLRKRAPRMVVFGGRGARTRAYGELRPVLAAACRDLGIGEIIDVGPPLDGSTEVDGVPVRTLGVLPPGEAGALLAGSLAGFVAYPSFFLPKSSIFAAYCAHGVLPVCAWPRPAEDGTVRLGEHYWRPGTEGDPERIAAAARAWYEGHSLARQAETFRDLLLR
ncbi:MAG TPA: glycosyltransferase family 1 protein [Thermoanaerobaculia bacterium]|nr:glycosyltransferase family 1 protein [Thermoanaerobaculia bacterium]